MFVAKVQLEGYGITHVVKWRDGKLSGEGAALIRERLSMTDPIWIVGMPVLEGDAILGEGCAFVEWLQRECRGRVELLEGRFPKAPDVPDRSVI